MTIKTERVKYVDGITTAQRNQILHMQAVNVGTLMVLGVDLHKSIFWTCPVLNYVYPITTIPNIVCVYVC